MLDRTMTPKRRFLAGIMGGRVDRTPVGSPTSVATVDQMEMTGAFFPDVHTDGRKAGAVWPPAPTTSSATTPSCPCSA